MPDTAEIPAFLPALPEIVLAVGAMALLMFGAFRGEHTARAVSWLSILLLLIVALIVIRLPEGKLVTFGGSFVVDPFARFQDLTLAGSAAAILIPHHLKTNGRKNSSTRFDPVATTGMLMLISAADLTVPYLGLSS
jgi:NADH-quinone oxidoreductase subunit N